jgi:hypothetical protein
MEIGVRDDEHQEALIHWINDRAIGDRLKHGFSKCTVSQCLTKLGT